MENIFTRFKVYDIDDELNTTELEDKFGIVLPPVFKLFVITGKHTFSSGIINLMDFKEKTNATFVGEETSGKPNHYGVVKYLTLPSSGLKVNYSTKYINNYKLDTNTFFPDVEIETSFDDYKNGIDPVFDYIKNL